MASLKWESLESDSRPDVWENWPGAVLLDDEIRHYCLSEQYKLIDPFHEKNLKPARYQLTLGSMARVGGEDTIVDEKHPLVIPAHQVAIVRTDEILNIPRFLIGRWNLVVDAVYKGLLWVGALQVDPGWVGYLPCPLYNLSDQPVTVEFREKLFTIDFVRTTKFSERCLRYPGKDPPPPINPPIGFYDPIRLRSGPYEKLREVEGLADFRDLATGLIAVLFAALAAVVVALSVIVIRPVVPEDGRLLSAWPLTALAVSGFALALSIFAVFVQYKNFRHRR